MKRWAYRLQVKVVAVILLLLFAVLTTLSAVGVYAAGVNGCYDRSSPDFFHSELIGGAAYRYLSELDVYVFDDTLYTSEEVEDLAQVQELLQDTYARDNCNLSICIERRDETGHVVDSCQNYAVEAPVWHDSYDLGWNFEVTFASDGQIYASDILYEWYWLYQNLFTLRYWLIVLLVVGFAGFLLLLVFLCCAVGRHSGEDGVRLNWFDRIPYDLVLAAVCALETIAISCASNITIGPEVDLAILLTIVASVLLVSFALPLVLTTAVRCKAQGHIWENTVLYRLAKLPWNGVKKAARALRRGVRLLPMVWRLALITAGILLLLLICTFGVYWQSGFWVVVQLLLYAAIVACILGGAMQQKRLQEAGAALAKGDFSFKLDTAGLYYDYKAHAEDLNAAADGLAVAVEQKMRSERLKTELITNVSHDIKTPLTSIVNYVDLLQKESVDSETAKEYIAVLSRQSARLKKLIEDLLEASKAATGNIAVELAPCDVCILLSQTAGEYAARLEAANLELVLQTPEYPVMILADGRRLWRVFDNLMNNICKYAQSATRVYLTVEPKEDTVCIIFRNISCQALHITADELMERFVRGDSSRNTEGSGLGLSIAKSLTELQKGNLELYIDGDLFKVILRFPRIAPEESEQ